MNFVTDRLRFFLFGIVVSFMGLVSPSKTLQALKSVVNRQDWIDSEIDKLSK